MIGRVRLATLLGAVVCVVSVVGCGDDDSGSAEPPTPDGLASRLVSADDFDGDWTIEAGPEGAEVPLSGVISEDQSELLPTFELCAAASAESRAAVEDLRWMAFRQINLTVDDPIDPPTDREGHIVFAQEFLLGGEADEVEATFGLLRDGLEACLGDVPASEEGPGRSESMTVPDLGDDRLGTLTTIEEEGGWAEWRLHNVLVRQGSILMNLEVVDIRAGDGVEPWYSIEEVGALAETAVDRL